MRTSHPMPCRLCRENARAAGATFGCLAVGAIHAHRFSPVIYNETLCRYTSRNFPSFSRETTSETESAMKIGAYGLPDREQPVTREFCETCGTHIATRRPGLNAVILKVGTLDDPSLFGAPQMAIYAVDRQPFHIIPESLPIYERLPPR